MPEETERALASQSATGGCGTSDPKPLTGTVLGMRSDIYRNPPSGIGMTVVANPAAVTARRTCSYVSLTSPGQLTEKAKRSATVAAVVRWS